MTVIRLRNPASLMAPDMAELVKGAIDASLWKGLEGVNDEITRMIGDPKTGVFAGYEEGWKALALVVLPASPLDPIPQVIHLYNIGSNSLRKELIQSIVDFVGTAGYNKFWAVNATGGADRAWAKVMKPDGWEVNPIGSIMEFALDRRP